MVNWGLSLRSLLVCSKGVSLPPLCLMWFIDMVVRKALMCMPENCVAFESRCKGRLSLAPMHISSC